MLRLDPGPGRPPSDLLEELTQACSLSGDEGEVRAVLRRWLGGTVCELYTDNIGNLICRRGQGPVRVIVAAHMDEVGLVVAGHDDSGLLRVKESGGLDVRVLPGRAVLVGRPKVPGVIGAPAVHLLDEDEAERVLPSRELYVDVGARSKEEAAEVAAPGDPVYFATSFERLSDRVVKAKALDDRVGCYILARLLLDPERENLTLLGVFTVQEEVGLRGARVAAQHLAPRLALAVDGTSAADVPGVEPPQTCTHLGRGPAVSLMDGTIVMHERIREHLVGLARRHGVPWQYRRLTTAGTDAGGIFLERTGIPACTVAVPCRYIHSPASLADLDDIEHTLTLLRLLLDSLDKGEFEP